jgi:preprotein translocase subunit SecB
MADESGNGESEDQRQVALQKIYIRDASIEVPDGPRIFTEEYQPEVNIDLNTQIQSLNEETHEVSLTVTVTAQQNERIAYIIEVQQAGVVQIEGFSDPEERSHVLGAYCPTILFPYVREAVGDMVARAGFPHFLLQPVNFDLLYTQHRTNEDNELTDASRETH